MSTALHVSSLNSATPFTLPPVDEAVALLSASFADEPNFVDLFPHPGARARALPHVFTGLWRDASKHGRIDLAWQADELVGVAVWLAPWAYPPSPARQARLVPALAAMVRAAPRSALRLMSFNRRLEALHPPQPYAYLAAIGTKPSWQGRHVGSQMLAAGLDWADESNVACYLEAQRPTTVAWYRRHGFEVQQKAPVLTGGAPNWMMLRPAKAS